MSNTGSYIIAIAVLILINAIFVMSEMAVIASRKARLQQRINDGDRRARTALQLAENPSIFLSTVQIGITLTGILLGAIGEDALRQSLGGWFAQFPLLEPYADALGFFIGVVIIITSLSLIFGELVPKRLALQNPEPIASFVAGPMFLISRVFAPFVNLMSAITDFILRLMGAKPSRGLPVTEEELQVLLDQGTQAGVFEESEQDMVEGIFRLGDRRVYQLMTQRTDIVWLDIHDTLDETRAKIAESPYSRFPVCQDSLDNVIGVVKARDLLVRSLDGKSLTLKECIQPALFIPETAFASRALEIFKENGKELVLVIDEFGGVQGLLTINDILTEIVGEIESGEPQATQRQDGSWLLDGMLPIDEFKEIFKVDALPEEDNYETLSGFVMSTLGRIPLTADQFEWNGLRFEVMDMDGRRVDKVLVTTLPSKPAP